MRTTAAALAGALALGVTGPASAASIGMKDPADIQHGVDLRSVVVDHAKALTHTNLRRHPGTGAGGAVYIDTDRSDPGPELVFLGGYSEGTDYQLGRTDRVRVAVKVSGTRADGEVLTDWLRKPRFFTPWVERG